MNQRRRKLMTMHKALRWQTICIKKRGRVLGSIEGSVEALIQWLEDYTGKPERGLITSIRNNTDNTIDNRMTITRKQKWEEKQLYGHFKRLINNISHDKTRTGLRKGNFKRETESLLIAAKTTPLEPIISKRCNKIANVGYVVIEMKPPIT